MHNAFNLKGELWGDNFDYFWLYFADIIVTLNEG